MFYWKEKTETGTTLEAELLSCNSVKKVAIATAYLSSHGIKTLQEIKTKYSLQRKDISLYLSSSFSTDKPHEILEQLSKEYDTRIVFEPFFHPKIYFFEGEPCKLIYGSSNFTRGGMNRNVEFDFIGIPTSDDIASLSSFWNYCNSIAKPVDEEVIKFFKDNQDKIDEIAKLHSAQKKLKSTLSRFVQRDDPFPPGKYELDDYYFKYEDYEIFFMRNGGENNTEITKKRKELQRKLLNINEKIYTQIKKLGIAHHKDTDHITSLPYPRQANNDFVGWMCVRYGKTPEELKTLKYKREEDDPVYGFQRHGCLQFHIDSKGFDIFLFLANEKGAVDRNYWKENKTIPQIKAELGKLRGEGMVWHIRNSQTDKPFDIDKKQPPAFCDYLQENDCEGYQSYLKKHYEPDNVILKSEDTICDEIVRVMTKLLPLYNAMVWRPNASKPLPF
jgi:HKD family nuclease